LRVLTQFARGQLVGRDAGVNTDAFRLFGVDARKPCGALARMIARAVAQRPALHLGQAGEDGEVLAERFQRLHGGRELETRAFRGGHPLIQNHADRVKDKPEANRGFGCTGHCQRRNHGVQQGQGQCGAETAQERAAGQRLLGDDHGSAVLLI
jgi:hypothetical protein